MDTMGWNYVINTFKWLRRWEYWALLCFMWLIVKGIFGSLKVYKQKKSKFEHMVCLSIIGGEIATVVHMLSSNLLNFMSISVLLSILMGIMFSKHKTTGTMYPCTFKELIHHGFLRVKTSRIINQYLTR